ncbi:MAG: glucose-6-phosphate isomerase [Betaproteobacteria bacterium]|nr:glucose-6-phosphate isomerase [Betaproteobacteria bacterium]
MSPLPTLSTLPPTDCPAWAKLAAHAGSARDTPLAALFRDDAQRGAHFGAQAPELRLDYSRQRVGALTLRLLAQLAGERGLAAWRRALFAGEPINVTEGRAVRHSVLRAGESAPAEVRAALARMRALAAGLAGVRRIVHLGTGGSDLGARLLMDALREQARIDVRFAANIDPLDLARALEGADPAATLVVAVSKTFTTAETLANAQAAKAWLGGRGRLFAVTANEAAARAFGAAEVLPMWDWVGGRYSVWSAASFSALAALGADAFEQFLAGARDMDRHFLEAPPEKNVPALLALLGVWNVNFLGAATHCVLPYAHALKLLPAYLQQLEMESNGKRVDREGRALAYATAPVVWGAEGTVSQHSFHQLLHQGTQVVPADFIVAGVSAALDANAEAQARALAFGTDDPALPAHRQYPGNRPSNTLRLRRVDARALGALIAAYEHKVFAQGVIWNVNSFDQWGVELGKQLAGRILKHENQGRT